MNPVHLKHKKIVECFPQAIRGWTAAKTAVLPVTMVISLFLLHESEEKCNYSSPFSKKTYDFFAINKMLMKVLKKGLKRWRWIKLKILGVVYVKDSASKSKKKGQTWISHTLKRRIDKNSESRLT